MSPARVYGYHTCLFSQAAPKLSFALDVPRNTLMAGHTKWASIQRRRAARVSGRQKVPVHPVGGPFKAVRYEGYGPGGAAIVVDSVTDDRSRTGAEVRETFTKYGGNLGAHGSVSYLFHTVGLMNFPSGTDESRLMQVALEAGAEDVVVAADGSIEVLADPVEFETVRAILAERGFIPTCAAVTERASLATPLSGNAAELTVHLLEALEDLDDVRDVYSNVEISDEVLARL
jgi:transcriptional/translational regulatory protein YebC/TACO1